MSELLKKVCGYIIFYNSTRVEVHAESLYAAKLKGLELLRVPKSKHGLVAVMLAEDFNGKQVVHSTSDI
jgi:hypothetical protein